MNHLLDEINVFFTSSDGERDLNNSRSKYHLNPPISFDQAVNVYFEVRQASLTYITPNISAALNNNTFLFSKDGAHQYVFPDGLYSLSDIQETLNEFVKNDLTTGVLAENVTLYFNYPEIRQKNIEFAFVTFNVKIGRASCREKV